uniref:Uncharacterized protein n=1 Tax=Lygus hesperus TaxID=30085 RepID=A0A0A9WFC3_LYGHE
MGPWELHSKCRAVAEDTVVVGPFTPHTVYMATMGDQLGAEVREDVWKTDSVLVATVRTDWKDAHTTSFRLVEVETLGATTLVAQTVLPTHFLQARTAFTTKNAFFRYFLWYLHTLSRSSSADCASSCEVGLRIVARVIGSDAVESDDSALCEAVTALCLDLDTAQTTTHGHPSNTLEASEDSLASEMHLTSEPEDEVEHRRRKRRRRVRRE